MPKTYNPLSQAKRIYLLAFKKEETRDNYEAIYAKNIKEQGAEKFLKTKVTKLSQSTDTAKTAKTTIEKNMK